jgi:5-methylcytosine-specific restriction endonuclease McrA
MACRSEAQKVAGITERQHSGLEQGRRKGTNNRSGYKHRPESRAKASASHKAFCAENPDRIAARGAKLRAERHYRWKGGVSRLNISVRRMTENRRWMDAIKERDGACVRCGAVDSLESHHLTPLAEMIERLGIKSREDARKHAGALWDLNNGITLCEACHYAEHGRSPRENHSRDMGEDAARTSGAL